MKTIAVLDENDAVREVLEDVLSEIDGWTVQSVTNGSDLLTLLETVTPDLIVLDTALSGLTYMEVYGLIRERTRLAEAPVLFLSTSKALDTTGLRGPFRWLEKPFEVDDLLGLTAELLGEDVREQLG